MKFTVRDGFVVNFVERQKQVIAGKEQMVEREYNVYPGDDPAELSEEQARAHAHKLEGADKDGKKFLEGLVRDPSTSQAEPSIPVSQVADLVAAEMAKALAAAGVKPPAAS